MIRAFRKHYRRITAFILTLVLTCMNIGTNLHVAFAVGEEEEALFLVDGAELKEAIQEACDSGEVFDFADLNLKAKTKTLKNAYEKLLGKKEGAVYELDVPVNDDYAPDGTSVKVFYNAATEDVAFLFINESDMVVTFRANVDGYETNRVTVNPNPANVEDGETAVYVEDYSNTIMIDDMPHTLGAELIGTEGNAEAGEGEPEQETEAEVPDGSESLEASTAAEETVEMTEEAEAEDTVADTLPEETEITVEEQPEEETEAVVIEIESAEETEEEAATESEVVIEPETETGELVGMSHHLVDRVGTPEETEVVILDETEETTEAPEEETEQEAEEEALDEPEKAAAESIEETEEKEPEENESSVEETTATAATDTEEESEEAVMEESSSAAVSEQTEEQESSTEETTQAAVEETTEGSVTEGTEAPEDGQLLIDDVNADGETAVVVLGDLEGKPYNTVTIWDSANARAFKVSVEDLEGIEAFGSYAVDYSVDPLGTAEVEGPSYIAEGEDLYFSVTPQVGYVIEQVLANGEEVELADEADLASLSDATKSNADPEDAEEGTALYVIPDVQEDQEIEVILAEEVLGSHPEFHEEKTVNGVTITVSAEEGILPAGTTLSVEEVTEQVADAVKENVEAEGKTTVTDVLAYDINLMLDGKKLSNSYWEGNYVNVKFEGSKIEEISKNADSLQIVSLETPTETVEAALGTTEKIPVLDNLTAGDIAINEEGREAIDVEGEIVVEEVKIEAAHFTIYAVVGETNVYTSHTIEVGESVELKCDISHPNVYTHQWVSSNENVATVNYNSATATVKGVSSGTVIITHQVKLRNGTYYDHDRFTIEVVDGYKIKWYVDGDLSKTTYAAEGEQPSYGSSNPTKDYADFAGWANEPNSKNYCDESELPVATADAEYYAVFTYNALFYFVLEGKSNTSTVASDYMFAGPDVVDGVQMYGKVIIPDGFNRLSRWYILQDIDDIDSYIIIGPTDQDIRKGIRAAYPNEYSSDWEYNIDWTTLSYATPSVGYNYAINDNGVTLHVDGALIVNKDTTAGINYIVTMPDGTVLTQSTTHKKNTTFDLNKTVQTSGTFETDGYSYDAVITNNSINYKFDGWYLDSNYAEKAPDEWTVTGIKTFYAKYIAQDELKYNPNGGTGTMIASTGNVNESVEVKKSLFTRIGYQFKSWNTKADGTGTDYNAGDNYTLTNEEDILYAQWEAIKANIYFKKVLKTVDGENSSGDVTTVTFSLYKANSNGTFSEDSSLLVEADIHPTADGVVTISDISYYGDDNIYYLKETSAAPGYNLLPDVIKITISFDADSNLQYKIGEDSKLYNPSEMYEIVNTTGLELPITGGSGLGFIKEFGWMLLILAAAMIGMEMGIYSKRRRNS